LRLGISDEIRESCFAEWREAHESSFLMSLALDKNGGKAGIQVIPPVCSPTSPYSPHLSEYSVISKPKIHLSTSVRTFRDQSWTGGVTQVIEHLSSKHEALSSNSSASKRETERERKRERDQSWWPLGIFPCSTLVIPNLSLRH
jgi:hypothetical protein